jgi:hypothetical protein
MNKNTDADGFRVAWFIPVEMVMSGTLLQLTIMGHGWMAFGIFILGFVPFFILLDKYLPTPAYESNYLNPAPRLENYNLDDISSAKKYMRDFDYWIANLPSFPNTSKIHHYERKELPKSLEVMLQRTIQLYSRLRSVKLEKRITASKLHPNTLTEQASP